MSKMNRFVSLLVICTLLAGCASIIHGSRQDIRVTSNPSGAVVRVNLNKMVTTTPGVLSLNRKEIGYALTFEKEGYKPVEVSLRRTVDGWLFGNILLLEIGIIGIIVDFANGSAYRLTPGEVEVALGQMDASLKKADGNILVFVDMEKLPEQVRARIAHEKKAA